jgi:rare lipoprotein A
VSRLAVAALLGVALLLSGCSLFRRRAVVQTPAHYTVGEGYQLGGVWYYPRERTEYDATGLAGIAPDHLGQTADGEQFDQGALAASHQTLQLPAIARVTNLENGRQILVRLNDRGPANPGRLIGLTRHAAALLGARDGTEIRVQLDSEMSHSLADKLGGGRIAVAAAPLAAVQAESLAPPPGIAQSSRGRTVAGPVRDTAVTATGPVVPDRLPDQLSMVPATPGSIYLRASEFGRIDYAQRLAAQLTGLNPMIERVRDGRAERYTVRAGPFTSVDAADAALDQARRAGVIDSRLVVE